MNKLNIIYKYTFHGAKPLSIHVSKNYEILDVINQKGRIVIYIAEEQSASKVIELIFHAIPTGERYDIVSSGEYISTVSLFRGDEVYHIYRER